jgi:hypothetical protein
MCTRFLNWPVRVVLEKAYETFHAVHSHIKDGVMKVSVSMAFSIIGVLFKLTRFRARVLNIVRVRTGEVRFFITELSMATLTPDQRRTVKRFAKDAIGSPAPVWSDVGPSPLRRKQV